MKLQEYFFVHKENKINDFIDQKTDMEERNG